MPNPFDQLSDPIPQQNGKMDIAAAMAKLTPENQEICLMLLKGYTKAEVARHLNLSPSLLYRRHLQKIRRIFQENLTEYVGKKPKVLPQGAAKPTKEEKAAKTGRLSFFCDRDHFSED